MPSLTRWSAVLPLAAVAGCAAVVPVPAAPHAADPVCAEVVLALPEDLDDMPRLRTNSQATVAWGEPDAPVVLRCGVEPPAPTTDPCVTAADENAQVDWVITGEWTFTTYGRSPAVEVVVPASVAREHSTSFLLQIGPAVEHVAQTRACL